MRFSLRAILASLAALAALPFSAQAQIDRSNFEVAFEARETQRRALVAQGLNLSEEEAEKFWPLYDDYRAEMKEFQLKVVETLGRYAENFDDLGDELASELVASALKMETERTKTQRDHLRRARKVLEPVDALRYYQIDSYIETAQAFAIRRQIPFAGTDLDAIMNDMQGAQASQTF